MLVDFVRVAVSASKYFLQLTSVISDCDILRDNCQLMPKRRQEKSLSRTPIKYSKLTEQLTTEFKPSERMANHKVTVLDTPVKSLRYELM